MIELVGLTKKYGDFAAVKGLDLSVDPGEIFGFIGPNGAGKTTTLKMMGGLLAPTAGTVTIDGVRMDLDPVSAKRRIGFIPDRPYLYEKLTGTEFLRFTAKLYGVDGDAFDARAEEKLELFGLSDWPNELIEAYSHGMKQRLIMSAALLHDPRVIIVDEPTVGLDPAATKMLKDLFSGLAESGITIFMSTHTLQVAEEICDRIGVINRGELIATGSVGELKHQAQVADETLEAVFLKLTAAALF